MTGKRLTAVSRIMLVDDEPQILKALKRVLNREAYDVEIYDDPEEALKRCYSATFDLVLSDYRMPKMDGVEFLSRLKGLQPDAMRLILSAYGDLEALKLAINEAEIYRFISKPWNDYDLKTAIAKALEHREMLVENRRLAEQVRQQEKQLDRHEAALRELQRKHPEIANVVWGEDGSVLLDDEGLD